MYNGWEIKILQIVHQYCSVKDLLIQITHCMDILDIVLARRKASFEVFMPRCFVDIRFLAVRSGSNWHSHMYIHML